MTRFRRLSLYGLALVALALIAFGMGLIWTPLGFIASGVGLLAIYIEAKT